MKNEKISYIIKSEIGEEIKNIEYNQNGYSRILKSAEKNLKNMQRIDKIINQIKKTDFDEINELLDRLETCLK